MSDAPAICLMGLTGTGKTALAMALSDRLSASIISVDSAMIYRGMNIGTAKPTPELLRQYPHHLVDIVSPQQQYSVADFVDDALRCYRQVQRPCILVGGTMMYFRALQMGLHHLPQTSSEVRTQLTQWREQHGQLALYQRLQACDPHTAARLNPNDRQRVQRALEVYETAKVPLSRLLASAPKGQHPIPYINLALIPVQRQLLHQRLAQRFDQMLADGLVDETRALLSEGVSPDSMAMRSVGYHQVCRYLQGEDSWVTMRERAIIATRQLAKRQHTWLRKWQNLSVFEPDDPKLLDRVYQQISQELKN